MSLLAVEDHRFSGVSQAQTGCNTCARPLAKVCSAQAREESWQDSALVLKKKPARKNPHVLKGSCVLVSHVLEINLVVGEACRFCHRLASGGVSALGGKYAEFISKDSTWETLFENAQRSTSQLAMGCRCRFSLPCPCSGRTWACSRTRRDGFGTDDYALTGLGCINVTGRASRLLVLERFRVS